MEIRPEQWQLVLETLLELRSDQESLERRVADLQGCDSDGPDSAWRLRVDRLSGMLSAARFAGPPRPGQDYEPGLLALTRQALATSTPEVLRNLTERFYRYLLCFRPQGFGLPTGYRSLAVEGGLEPAVRLILREAILPDLQDGFWFCLQAQEFWSRIVQQKQGHSSLFLDCTVRENQSPRLLYVEMFFRFDQ